MLAKTKYNSYLCNVGNAQRNLHLVIAAVNDNSINLIISNLKIQRK